MNLDSTPPVRPLLTHVIADEPLRREAGIMRPGNILEKCQALYLVNEG